MIAFSACIGFGLFLQNGRAIYLAGPGLATLAYFLMGTIMWSSTASLGEMTALFPVKGTHLRVSAALPGRVSWLCYRLDDLVGQPAQQKEESNDALSGSHGRS